jgi:hypothetical protein
MSDAPSRYEVEKFNREFEFMVQRMKDVCSERNRLITQFQKFGYDFSETVSGEISLVREPIPAVRII